MYKFKEFNFKKGDVVRVLNKKALFAKGTYEYSRDLYKIVKIDDKKDYDSNQGGQSQVKTGQYQLKNIKGGDLLKKQYQGYELLLADQSQEKEGYDIVKVEQNLKEEALEKKREQVETALNQDIGKDQRADIDKDAEDFIVEIEAPISANKLGLKPKDKIKVFWSDDSAIAEKQNKFNKNTKGKFYPANVLKIMNENDPDKIKYFVQFSKDKPPNKYSLNLTRKNQGDFIAINKGWKKA